MNTEIKFSKQNFTLRRKTKLQKLRHTCTYFEVFPLQVLLCASKVNFIREERTRFKTWYLLCPHKWKRIPKLITVYSPPSLYISVSFSTVILENQPKACLMNPVSCTGCVSLQGSENNQLTSWNMKFVSCACWSSEWCRLTVHCAQ